MELDYNDQCDIVYGRLRRLVNEDPSILKKDDIIAFALPYLKGLGLSGGQVEMVFAQLKEEMA